MSINHFSSELPDTIWWTQQQHHQSSLMEQIPQNTLFHHHLNTGQNTPFSFNLNEQEEEKDKEMKLQSEEAVFIAKEAMFEKPLTPSDVGKLNRLVIPKQHAEKYFPLGGINDSVEKGLLLSFEDESGKTWRFRYSYWNSSQSYVLTKGWSRFVKEKRLEAGDVVVFDRFRTQGDRFFIGWRRRNAPPPENMPAAGWNRLYYSGYPYPTHPTSLPYQTHCPHAVVGGGSAGGTQNQTKPGGNSKTVLRLFGVNLECQSDEPIAADGSSQSQREAQGQPHYYSNFSNHHTHMQDTNFSRTR